MQYPCSGFKAALGSVVRTATCTNLDCSAAEYVHTVTARSHRMIPKFLTFLCRMQPERACQASNKTSKWARNLPCAIPAQSGPGQRRTVSAGPHRSGAPASKRTTNGKEQLRKQRLMQGSPSKDGVFETGQPAARKVRDDD